MQIIKNINGIKNKFQKSKFQIMQNMQIINGIKINFKNLNFK